MVVDPGDTVTPLSLRNVSETVILSFDQLNTYDVLLSDDVVFTQAASTHSWRPVPPRVPRRSR